MILKLTMEYGLHPKRVASTNGGEYHSPCPYCGGKDRFIIWSAKNRYYCRQCKAKGDSIQFCREFLGMTFQDAYNKTGADQHYYFRPRTFCRKFEPKNPEIPSQAWQEKALAFVRTCNTQLLNSPEMIDALKKERGLSEDSIRKFCIGWNARSFYERAESFGLKSQNAASNKIYLDRGFVIPFFGDKILTKVKIRRADWHHNGQLSKYYELTGSMPVSSIFDYFPKKRSFLIVEAEFDAMLISQSVGNICCTVALGGASKKPDLMTHQLLLKSPLILFALDFDEAGKNAFRFWKETYPNLYAWPVPKEKGPCDALKAGVDLKAWVLAGIEHFQTTS